MRLYYTCMHVQSVQKKPTTSSSINNIMLVHKYVLNVLIYIYLIFHTLKKDIQQKTRYVANAVFLC